jgi:spore germination protein YaaH
MKNFTLLGLLLAACSGSGSGSHSTDGPAITGVDAALTSVVAQDVVWTQLVNASASGNNVTKSGGQDHVADSGAVSAQLLSAGDGWLEVSAAETTTYRFVGLGRAHSGVSGNAIDFAFRVQGGQADIYEGGVYRADNPVAAGDLLRVAVTSGVVGYYKNGALVYTSSQAPAYPLLATAALIDSGSAVTSARFAADPPVAAALTVSAVSAVPRADGAGATITWTSSGVADGQVQYGTSTSYGSWSVYSATAATSHSIALDGLTAGTTYHYRVRSEDGAGHSVLSADAIFIATKSTSSGNANSHHFCGWLMATGYVAIEQDPNYADFVAHADTFDAVHPTWYHLASPTTFAPSFGEGAAAILANTTAGGKRTLLIPTIAGADGNAPSWASQMVHDATLRAQHEAAIVNLVTAKHYDGIDLDYEHLPDADRDAFSLFAAELGAKLHALGKTLSFAVGGLITARFSHWDYTKLAAAADQLHIMGYDFHYIGSHPGPVAPLAWIQQVVAYAGTISGGSVKSKFILGIPNYGVAGSDSGVSGWFGSAMDSINLTGGSYATSTTHMEVCPLTNGTSMPAGRAPNATTVQGHLFFDDLGSMEEKVAAAQAGGLGGVTYWTIGGEPDRPGPRTFFEMMRLHFPK